MVGSDQVTMMRGSILILSMMPLLSGCGCDERITGDPDATDTPDETTSDMTEDLVGDGGCGECDDENPCTVDSCDPVTAECVHDPLDGDGDGAAAMRAPDGTECGGTDCDDTDEAVHPGAEEVCADGVDQDCDTVVDGPVVMMEDVRVSNLPRGRGYPHAYLDMVWTGSTYGLAWVWEYSSVFWWSEVTFTLVDGDGVPSGEEVAGSAGMSPVMAWSGSEFAIASMGPMLGPAPAVSLLRVSEEGVVVVESAPVTGMFPQIAWSGSEYGLTRNVAGSTNESVFVRLDPTGSVAGADLTLAPADPVFAVVTGLAWTGSEYGVVWTGLEFARVSADGSSRGDPVTLAESGSPLRVGLVWTGSGYGAAWISESHEVAFTTFGPEGLDASEVAVLGEGYSGPDIAWTGSRFGILWAHGDEVVLRMVDPRGEADGESIAIAGGAVTEVDPAIAWTGSELGVAWYDTRYLETEGNWIFVNRIGFCE